MADIRVLGEMRLSIAGRPVDPGPRQQRAVLAALALDAGHAVPIEVLVDRIWGTDASPGSRKVLHVQLTRVRRRLLSAQPDASAPVCVERCPEGYRITLTTEDVDLHRFHGLLDSARGSNCDGERARLLEGALALWRGTPLAGLTGNWAEQVRDRAQRERLDAVIEWATLVLRAGRQNEVLVRLAGLEDEYPLSEPLTGVQMRALVASGRQAKALDCFTRARRRLAQQLGVDPGPDLVRLRTSILRAEQVNGAAGDGGHPPAKTSPSPPVGGAAWRPVRRPAQLPCTVRFFTGRSGELSTLDSWLAEGLDGRQGCVLVVAGPAGVGKTALAVHWSHRVAARFPDGQLFLDLAGRLVPGGTAAPCGSAAPDGSAVPDGSAAPDGTAAPGGSAVPGGNGRETGGPGAPTPARHALGAALRALGVPPEDVPEDTCARTALYRGLLADRRVLVVLDDAGSPDQVGPLLPDPGRSAVIITSRDPLPGLADQADRAGVRRLTLGPLPEPDAIALVTALLNLPADVEPLAARLVARSCAGLPLALRRIVEYAQARGLSTLAEFESALAGGGIGLDVPGPVPDVRTGPVGRPSLSLPGLEASSNRSCGSGGRAGPIGSGERRLRGERSDPTDPVQTQGVEGTGRTRR
ncbi:MAG: hypothetical protein GXX79_08740 [Actinomycetales bacterium]|nr:hypothetical protein [Actinomycetales bacterium]